MECEFCQNHEQGDTLYEPSDWDGGIGFDYIRDIKYCPLCGSLLDGEAKDEPTISKMEQVDKDINVRSKTEPQTNADQHVQHVESVKDETGHWVRVGQWEWEHHTDTTHFGKTKGESITTNKVEDEPQTERSSE